MGEYVSNLCEQRTSRCEDRREQKKKYGGKENQPAKIVVEGFYLSSIIARVYTVAYIARI